jgi:hypothetical protein
MKRMPAISYILITFLITSALFAHAQDKIDSAVNLLGEKYQQEQVYIAYNKAHYVAGETIGYKAFVFAGYQLSYISTNLYVELLNQQKKVIAQQRIPVISGMAEGGLTIPDSTAENVYYIRAYTNWMLNFNEAFQYIHPLLIYNPDSPEKLQPNPAAWQAAAFAEGGALLQNIPARVVVRLLSTGALPQHWQGYLIDSLQPQEKIVSFQSLNQNIASFNFVPKAGTTYQVIVQGNDGTTKQVSLPVVATAGVNLMIKQTDTALQYAVRFRNVPADATYKLVGTVDNNIVYKAGIKNNNSAFVHSFSTKDMLKGVLRLTLFDDNYNAVAERLCFIQPTVTNDVLTDSVNFNKTKRAPNGFNVKLDSGQMYFALVLDEETPTPYLQDNLLSAFWLTPGITGNINNAASYIAGTDSSKQALDALLVTEKWNRFNWPAVLAGKYPAITHTKDNFLAYKATVRYKNKLLTNTPLSLAFFMPDSTRQFYQAKTDAEGTFVIDSLVFEGNAGLSYKINNKKIFADDVKIELTKLDNTAAYSSALPIPAYTVAKPAETAPPPAEIVRSVANVKTGKAVQESTRMLKEVIVKTIKKTPTQLLDEKLSSGRFYNPREVIYDFVNTVQSGAFGNDLYYWLQGRVPGDPNKVSYFIDEFKADKSQVKMTPISDVAMVKIQGRGDSHQVFIYLRRGEEMLQQIKPLNNITIEGYKKTAAFIMPYYNNPQVYNEWKNDTREVLCWSNLLYTDTAAQQIKIKFFNNDITKKFRVIVMGFKDEATPVWREEVY